MSRKNTPGFETYRHDSDPVAGVVPAESYSSVLINLSGLTFHLDGDVLMLSLPTFPVEHCLSGDVEDFGQKSGWSQADFRLLEEKARALVNTESVMFTLRGRIRS